MFFMIFKNYSSNRQELTISNVYKLAIDSRSFGGPFTPQIILAVVWSCCGGLEQTQLTCSVLLVVEVTKQLPGPGLAGSRLTKT